MIYKTELAQAVAGCDLDPAIVREGKEKLFEDKLYNTVFPTTEPYYYLNRYWLMCTVGAAASGYPERAYAKWLVLNFVWSRIRSTVQSRTRAERFRHEWEGNGKGLDYLWGMNNAAFGAALQFFRKKRGKGMKARDVSSFFKRRNLHTQFEKFWHGSNNSHRGAFQRNLKKLEKLLTEEK